MDYTGCFLETLSLTEEENKQYDEENFDAEAFLSDKGYNLSNCHWMVSDEDSIPVYTYGEVIPYTCI